MAPGERRTAIEKIEHKSNRQVTFSKRRKGLFHKAEDYADVCHAEIGVIVFSNTNRLYVFSSTSMQQILSRYVNYRGDVVAMDDDDESPEKSPEHEVVKQDSRSSSHVANAMVLLEEEGRALNLDCSRLTGRELDGISLEELNDLERRIREGIESIQKRKTQVQKNYCEYKPSYVLAYPHHYLDRTHRSNSQLFVGSSSSGVSDCSESEKSDDRIDTSLRL